MPPLGSMNVLSKCHGDEIRFRPLGIDNICRKFHINRTHFKILLGPSFDLMVALGKR